MSSFVGARLRCVRMENLFVAFMSKLMYALGTCIVVYNQMYLYTEFLDIWKLSNRFSEIGIVAKQNSWPSTLSLTYTKYIEHTRIHNCTFPMENRSILSNGLQFVQYYLVQCADFEQ